MYELGKYGNYSKKGTVKGRALWKQYIKVCKNEYKKDYREKKLDKSELDRIPTTLTSSIMHFIH